MWALIASLYVGNVMLLVLNLPLIRLWVKVLEIPRAVLYTAILVFATLGVYSISGSVTEVLIAYAIGVLGFGMRRYDFPIAPVVLGVILGPLAELQLRRTLLVSDGDCDRARRPAVRGDRARRGGARVRLPLLPGLIARLRGERFEGKKIVFGEED